MISHTPSILSKIVLIILELGSPILIGLLSLSTHDKMILELMGKGMDIIIQSQIAQKSSKLSNLTDPIDRSRHSIDPSQGFVQT